jgi:hypothetical protein
MNELGYRNIWITLAIIIPVGAIGLYILRYDQQAKGMMVFALLVLGGILCHTLDAREMRRRGQTGRPR